jgi:predicted nuclease with TOPRIM domain
MSIDQLIRDLIEEDTFKAKYTTRQRTIFCKNMYEKVSKFLEDSFDEEMERIKELELELDESKHDLEVYKNSYQELSSRYEELSNSYQELTTSYKSIFADILAAFRFAISVIYLYAMWQFYKDKLETSIKDINNTSVTPYNNA